MKAAHTAWRHLTYYLFITLVFISCSEKEKAKVLAPNLYPIKENSRYGYMDQSGKVVVAPSYDFAWDLRDGMGRIKSNGKYGFVNDKGEVVIKPQFAYADDFQDGYARINITDTLVVDVQYSGYDLNKGWTFVDKKGVVFARAFAKAEYIKTGYAQVKDDPAYDAPWSYASLSSNLTPEERNTEAMFAFNGHELAPASDTETGKIGAINKAEQWVIQPVFDQIETFSEGFAAAKKDNQFGYIDTRGNWIYSQVVSINENYYLSSDFRPFTNGVAVVKFAENSYGYIDSKGKVAIALKFKYAAPFNKDGYAIVSNEVGTGLIDRKGDFIIKPNLDIVSADNGIVIYRNGESFGARELATQKEIVPAIYDEIVQSGDMLRLKNKGATYGFINRMGDFSVAPQYELAWEFVNGKAIVQEKGKYFYVDTSGKKIGEVPEELQPFYYKPSSVMYSMISDGKFGFSAPDKDGLALPAEYDFATNFEGNIARVNLGATLNEEEWEYRGGKWGIINTQGKPVVPVTYELILPFNNGIALFNVGGTASYSMCDGEGCEEEVFYSCEGGSWGMVNTEGKVVLEAKAPRIIPFGKNFLVQGQDNQYQLISNAGDVLHTGPLSLHIDEEASSVYSLAKEKFVKVSENGKSGILDANGKWIIQPAFDDLKTGAEPLTGGLVLVQVGGLWGAADNLGNMVIPAEYEDIRYFASGLAAVKQNGEWGFINRQNVKVIEPSFFAVRDFQGDVAIVQVSEDSNEGVIDKSGELIIVPSPGITYDYQGFVHGLCVINGTEENEAAGYPVSTAGVISSSGKIIFNRNALSEARIQPNGILYAIKDGKWAIATHEGAMLSGYNYTWIEPYTGQELIRCNVGGDIAYGEYGDEEVPYGGRWGFIDKTGKVKIPFQFSEAGPFANGLAPVSTSEDLDEIGYVDFQGKVIRKLTR